MENHSIKDLETYKKLVEKCLRENYNHTEKRVQSLMKRYEQDFKSIFEEGFSPEGAAIGMVMNLL